MTLKRFEPIRLPTARSLARWRAAAAVVAAEVTRDQDRALDEPVSADDQKGDSHRALRRQGAPGNDGRDRCGAGEGRARAGASQGRTQIENERHHEEECFSALQRRIPEEDRHRRRRGDQERGFDAKQAPRDDDWCQHRCEPENEGAVAEIRSDHVSDSHVARSDERCVYSDGQLRSAGTEADEEQPHQER
jgi:hypothetical protein